MWYYRVVNWLEQNIKWNKKASKSKANRPLANRRMGYIYVCRGQDWTDPCDWVVALWVVVTIQADRLTETTLSITFPQNTYAFGKNLSAKRKTKTKVVLIFVMTPLSITVRVCLSLVQNVYHLSRHSGFNNQLVDIKKMRKFRPAVSSHHNNYMSKSVCCLDQFIFRSFFLKIWKDVLSVKLLVPCFGFLPYVSKPGESPTFMHCHLCIMNSSGSPLVWHLLTSWQPTLLPTLFDPHTFSSIDGTWSLNRVCVTVCALAVWSTLAWIICRT